MSDSNATLAPCPWCGKQPTLKPWIDGGVCMIHSGSCDFVEPTLFFDSEKEAVDAWNTRHERMCEIVEWYEARDVSEIGNNRVRFSCGHLGSSHDRYCVECGARVVKEEA